MAFTLVSASCFGGSKTNSGEKSDKSCGKSGAVSGDSGKTCPGKVGKQSSFVEKLTTKVQVKVEGK